MEENNNIKNDFDLLEIISDLKSDIFQKVTQLEKLIRYRAKKDFERLNKRNNGLPQ